MKPYAIILPVLVAGVGGLTVFAWRSRIDSASGEKLLSVGSLAKAETLPAAKKRKYFEDFVDSNSASHDAKVQDAVTSARMRLAYLDANQKNPEEARERFLEAEKKHSGSDAMDPAYGTMPDQARYQAINCLMIEGKGAEAKKEYLAFLKERPLSPLVYGVHKRLVDLLDKGETRDEIDRLLQEATDQQSAHNKREMALCGPRCIEKLIELKKLDQVSLDEIRERCGTTDEGTTMSGMQKGLISLSIKSKGMLVNREDFVKAQLPFVWLNNQHYLLVHTRKDGKVVVYDPFIRNDREISIPASSTDFSATILTTR